MVVPVSWNGKLWDFDKALMMSLVEDDSLEEIENWKGEAP
ncbi:hypothetical protein PF005_g27279 [Phytophthora fragariae]|uniref:Uncharacterized protein n=1 Tax=Phytophthora fragariae TaxID=53985 RepID=A0A6A3HKA0_9STRA|nr:hypothetical protein PF009_g28238 [Phytophthora fragariae]KAE8970160.1 hypothetical protein PF011_g26525 [Phytophthora fragariae]KAE9069063.1 hypothetical protein PF007_g27459 [Phytophthora fragariae]KAE9081206.1 hypothetical protein PF006_g27161 [Phytophthora fragariae]KAE9171116.1 hypothetical protein PF005_g27279 [Phytophthora fragariae]